MSEYKTLPAVLPFYDSEQNQARNKPNSEEFAEYELNSAADSFLPFQFAVPQSWGKPTRWALIGEDAEEYDLTAERIKMSIYDTLAGERYFLYKGDKITLLNNSLGARKARAGRWGANDALPSAEKVLVNAERSTINAAHTTLWTAAQFVGLETEYSLAYNGLISYLSPILNSLSVPSLIFTSVFRSKFRKYYEIAAMVSKKAENAIAEVEEQGHANLLLNTDFKTGIEHWNPNGTGETLSWSATEKAMNINNGGDKGAFYQNADISGGNYVVSFEVKPYYQSGGNYKVAVYVGGVRKEVMIHSTKEYKKYFVFFENVGSESPVIFQPLGSDQRLYFRRISVTKNLSGEWRPAVAEIDLNSLQAMGLGSDCGTFYMRFDFANGKKLFSEHFNIKAFSSEARSGFLKIDFSNSFDIQPVLYREGFRQNVFLSTFVDRMLPELEQEMQKDGENNEVPIFQKLVQRLQASDLVPDFLKVALLTVPMHDSVKIDCERYTGEINRMQITATPEEMTGLNDVSLRFEIDTSVKTNCEENEAATKINW